MSLDVIEMARKVGGFTNIPTVNNIMVVLWLTEDIICFP